MVAVLILLVIIVVLVFWAVGIFNGLVALRNRFKNAFAQIDVQLKRRYDLIPNLVEVAKGYMKHERETLESVIKARNSAQGAAQAANANPGDPAAMQALGQAEGALTGVLGRMFALAESYPTSRPTFNMLSLQEELSSTENKVAFCAPGVQRRGDGAQHQARIVPGQLLRRHVLNFGPAELLQATESAEERKAPQVSFLSPARDYARMNFRAPMWRGEARRGGRSS